MCTNCVKMGDTYVRHLQPMKYLQSSSPSSAAGLLYTCMACTRVLWDSSKAVYLVQVAAVAQLPDGVLQGVDAH